MTMATNNDYEDKVFMTQPAYEKFCAIYPKSNKARIHTSNIQRDKRWQDIARQGYVFMIEIPYSLVKGTLEMITKNPEICRGATGKGIKENTEKNKKKDKPFTPDNPNPANVVIDNNIVCKCSEAQCSPGYTLSDDNVSLCPTIKRKYAYPILGMENNDRAIVFWYEPERTGEEAKNTAIEYMKRCPYRGKIRTK